MMLRRFRLLSEGSVGYCWSCERFFGLLLAISHLLAVLVSSLEIHGLFRKMQIAVYRVLNRSYGLQCIRYQHIYVQEDR